MCRWPTPATSGVTGDEAFEADPDGEKTINYLLNAREMVRRLCSTYPSSLGLHPALYFYSPGGVFQPGALLAFMTLFKGWDTKEFLAFTAARSKFEEFLLAHRGMTEAVRRLGSGARSRPRILAFYRTIISNIEAGKSVTEIHDILVNDADYAFLVVEPPPRAGRRGATFKRDTKGGRSCAMHSRTPQNARLVAACCTGTGCRQDTAKRGAPAATTAWGMLRSSTRFAIAR